MINSYNQQLSPNLTTNYSSVIYWSAARMNKLYWRNSQYGPGPMTDHPEVREYNETSLGALLTSQVWGRVQQQVTTSAMTLHPQGGRWARAGLNNGRGQRLICWPLDRPRYDRVVEAEWHRGESLLFQLSPPVIYCVTSGTDRLLRRGLPVRHITTVTFDPVYRMHEPQTARSCCIEIIPTKHGN